MEVFDKDLSAIDLVEEICPEAVFKPKYPKIFKFNLILKSEDWGEVEVIVKKGIVISELKGAKKALKKIDELAKKLRGEMIPLPPPDYEVPFVYPLKDLMSFSEVFIREKDFKENGDFEKMIDFISNSYAPIDEIELLIKKGIKITY